MIKKFSRRDILKALAAVAGSLGLGKLLGTSPMQGAAQEMDEYIYLPIILKSDEEVPEPPPTVEPPPTPTLGKVVHVHSEDATFWNGQTDYWNFVDQDVLNNMIDQGVMALTGTSTAANAWRALLPNYRTGEGIAIKINLNNSWSCDDADGYIDALIQPVNAIVRGLKQIGVAEMDIWIYDALRWMPNRLVNGSQYPDIQYFDRGGACRNLAGFDSNDPTAYVVFSSPSGIPTPSTRKITDVLVNASYLINMPIMKNHTGSGVTLSFKNHLGTVSNPDLHDYIYLWGNLYRTDYNPLVNLYQNPHILEKTILIVGDGLFACKEREDGWPSLWATFGHQLPNSLFLATDPVAIDCIMCDFLAAETRDYADDYLQLAGTAGLGVFERGDPWGSGYNQIDYLKIEV